MVLKVAGDSMGGRPQQQYVKSSGAITCRRSASKDICRNAAFLSSFGILKVGALLGNGYVYSNMTNE